MNISNIKKNKFWISLGGGVIFVIVFYILVVNPFRVKNANKVDMIENALRRLERYERMGSKIHNEKWIAAAEAKLGAIRNVRLEYEEFYRDQDHHLEKFFASDEGKDIKDEALWGKRYIREVNIILDRIKDHNILLNENALPFKEMKSDIPYWEDIVPEQKKFWITEELINIRLKKELKVGYLEGINFGKENVSPVKTSVELCDIIPFTIRVSMDVEGLLFLINEFLKSKMPFEIETVSISGELNRSGLSKEAEKFYQSLRRKNIQQYYIVDVIIEAYVMDFKI